MRPSMRIAPLNAELAPPRGVDGTVAIGRSVLLPLRAGAWPRHVAFPLAAFLLFLGIAAAIALACGVRFVLPTEARSPALGFSGTVPVLVAALGYAAALLLARKAARRDNRRLLGDTLTDLLYLALFIGTSTLYFQLKLWMPLVNHALYDQALFSVDQRLHPLLDGVSRLRNGIAAGLPMADFWYQGAQLGLFILSFWGLAFCRDRRWHQHNVTALLLNLMIGALAYLLVPAVGPFVFEQGQNAAASQAQHAMLEVFDAARTQGAAWIAAHGGEHFTAAPAAMPSLHLSAALIVIYYTARARSALLPLMVAFGGWIAIEALAARWHYLADLPAGAPGGGRVDRGDQPGLPAPGRGHRPGAPPAAGAGPDGAQAGPRQAAARLGRDVLPRRRQRPDPRARGAARLERRGQAPRLPAGRTADRRLPRHQPLGHRPEALEPARGALARPDHLRLDAERAGLPLDPGPVGRPRALRPHRQALGRRVPLRPRDLRARVPGAGGRPTC